MSKSMDWKDLRPDVKRVGMKALSDGAEYLLGETIKVIPLDEGHAQRSGIVTLGEGEANISFDTPYVARLHEHPEYNFQNGRKGKFLEDTLNGPAGEKAQAFIADAFRNLFRG